MVTRKTALTQWVESYLFESATLSQKLLSVFLLPLTLLYCLVIWVKKRSKTRYIPPLPVISIGNLTVGGSGKTPVTIELARRHPKSAVVLRGYGRDSKGLLVIRDWEGIREDVLRSGDEAMVYAEALAGSLVIVAEDRIAGIEKAHEMGALCVFLDDGHSKYPIQKLDILIRPFPEPKNRFCLPSGAYRERYSNYAEADYILEEKSGLTRKTRLENPTGAMVLVTAIAKPGRLDPFLPEVKGKVYFEDHHAFTKEELETALAQFGADAILCTAKDAVKIRRFGLPLCLLALEVELEKGLLDCVREYIGHV